MMHTREEMLRSINKPEDKLVLAKLLDKAGFTAKTNKPAHSEFLDPHQTNLAERFLTSMDTCEYRLFGGFPGAERVIAAFYPDFLNEDEREEYNETILKVLEIKPNASGSLSHRDYLGALMSLGIRREVTGDIIVEAEKCSIVVLNDISAYIASNLFKVGNIGVNMAIIDIIDLSIPVTGCMGKQLIKSTTSREVTEIKTTVAALRLDSICAQAFGISRSKAAEFIKAGRVNLNWEMAENPDKLVREGDTISLKGKGRAILEKVGGKTRKDRLAISISKLV
jgi:RNA-binding protein YlmH